MSEDVLCQHCGQQIEEKRHGWQRHWVHVWSQTAGCVEPGTYKVWRFLDGSPCRAFPQ